MLFEISLSVRLSARRRGRWRPMGASTCVGTATDGSVAQCQQTLSTVV